MLVSSSSHHLKAYCLEDGINAARALSVNDSMPQEAARNPYQWITLVEWEFMRRMHTDHTSFKGGTNFSYGGFE
jgi:hypothetical protein